MNTEQDDNHLNVEKEGTQFKLVWAQALEEKEKERKEDTPDQEDTDSDKKGKDKSLSDKVDGANIQGWDYHKLNPVGFFVKMKNTMKGSNLESEPCVKNLPSEARGDFKYIDSIEDGPEYVKLKEDGLNKEVDEAISQAVTQYIGAGLSKEEAELKLQKDGPNKLPEKKKTPEWLKFVHELTSIFAMLLWIGGILAFIGYALDPSDNSNAFLGGAIIIINFLTGVFSYVQNRKGESIMNSFKGLSGTKVEVVRDGQTKEINSEELTVGDVVNIKIGEKVPADIRVFKSGGLKVDNSSLTGESELVNVKEKCGKEGLENPLAARNICFFGTDIKEGSATGVVFMTGKDTYMGKIADLASTATATTTTLQKEINMFIEYIGVVAITTGILFFIAGLLFNYPIITNLIFAIGVVVANVPEGLLAMLTLSLALIAKKMYTKNVMVKNLQSVETLGSTTCICSDKTGTLTKNKMTVVHMWYDNKIWNCKESDDDNDGNEKQVDEEEYEDADATHDSFKLMQTIGVCGSAARFVKETPDDFVPLVQERNKMIEKEKNITNERILEINKDLIAKYQDEYNKVYEESIDDRKVNGDASETGIIKLFERFQSVDGIRERYAKHEINGNEVKIDFNSRNKFAAFMRKLPEGENNDSHFILCFKGAPERVLDRCSHYLLNGKEAPIDSNFHKGFKDANKSFAVMGERVLAFAYIKLPKDKYPLNYQFVNNTGNSEKDPNSLEPNYPITNLVFAGLISLEDPPRDGVKNAIRICKQAGIKVIMVTGDQKLTAASIANQIGIIERFEEIPEIIMDNRKLNSIEEAEKLTNTIVVDGNRLNKMLELDKELAEGNPNKGEFLRKWLMKDNIVFARTSPDQKLIIVQGCQDIQHVVAVTGDGVNDSPAIKKADIGIAMGKVGTEVAKDAADIILLDDDFTNIVKGIKLGRMIFDILKKIVGYTLTSNIPELMPFIALFILQMPLGLTTILILCVDVGTDVGPSLGFSSEASDSNIMKRPPRNINHDHICSLRLFSYAYLINGMIEFAASYVSFFVVLSDFGFKPLKLLFFILDKGYEPGKNDVYSGVDAYRGNSNFFMWEERNLLQLTKNKVTSLSSNIRELNYNNRDDDTFDQRVFFPEKDPDFWGFCGHDSVGFFDQEMCYTIEATRSGNGAVLLATIMMQIANGQMFRTLNGSILEHNFKNMKLNFAYFGEIILMLCLLYIPGLNDGFGIRPLRIEHWVPPLIMFCSMILWDECRKWLVRNVRNPDGSKGFFARYFSF